MKVVHTPRPPATPRRVPVLQYLALVAFGRRVPLMPELLDFLGRKQLAAGCLADAMAALALGSHLLAVALEREVERRLALIWLPDGVSRELLVEVHHRRPQADGMHLLHGVCSPQ